MKFKKINLRKIFKRTLITAAPIAAIGTFATAFIQPKSSSENAIVSHISRVHRDETPTKYDDTSNFEYTPENILLTYKMFTTIEGWDPATQERNNMQAIGNYIKSIQELSKSESTKDTPLRGNQNAEQALSLIRNDSKNIALYYAFKNLPGFAPKLSPTPNLMNLKNLKKLNWILNDMQNSIDKDKILQIRSPKHLYDLPASNESQLKEAARIDKSQITFKVANITVQGLQDLQSKNKQVALEIRSKDENKVYTLVVSGKGEHLTKNSKKYYTLKQLVDLRYIYLRDNDITNLVDAGNNVPSLINDKIKLRRDEKTGDIAILITPGSDTIDISLSNISDDDAKGAVNIGVIDSSVSPEYIEGALDGSLSNIGGRDLKLSADKKMTDENNPNEFVSKFPIYKSGTKWNYYQNTYEYEKQGGTKLNYNGVKVVDFYLDENSEFKRSLKWKGISGADVFANEDSGNKLEITQEGGVEVLPKRMDIQKLAYSDSKPLVVQTSDLVIKSGSANRKFTRVTIIMDKDDEKLSLDYDTSKQSEKEKPIVIKTPDENMFFESNSPSSAQFVDKDNSTPTENKIPVSAYEDKSGELQGLIGIVYGNWNDLYERDSSDYIKKIKWIDLNNYLLTNLNETEESNKIKIIISYGNKRASAPKGTALQYAKLEEDGTVGTWKDFDNDEKKGIYTQEVSEKGRYTVRIANKSEEYVLSNTPPSIALIAIDPDAPEVTDDTTIEDEIAEIDNKEISDPSWQEFNVTWNQYIEKIGENKKEKLDSLSIKPTFMDGRSLLTKANEINNNYKEWINKYLGLSKTIWNKIDYYNVPTGASPGGYFKTRVLAGAKPSIVKKAMEEMEAARKKYNGDELSSAEALIPGMSQVSPGNKDENTQGDKQDLYRFIEKRLALIMEDSIRTMYSTFKSWTGTIVSTQISDFLKTTGNFTGIDSNSLKSKKFKVLGEDMSFVVIGDNPIKIVHTGKEVIQSLLTFINNFKVYKGISNDEIKEFNGYVESGAFWDESIYRNSSNPQNITRMVGLLDKVVQGITKTQNIGLTLEEIINDRLANNYHEDPNWTAKQLVNTLSNMVKSVASPDTKVEYSFFNKKFTSSYIENLAIGYNLKEIFKRYSKDKYNFIVGAKAEEEVETPKVKDNEGKEKDDEPDDTAEIDSKSDEIAPSVSDDGEKPPSSDTDKNNSTKDSGTKDEPKKDSPDVERDKAAIERMIKGDSYTPEFIKKIAINNGYYNIKYLLNGLSKESKIVEIATDLLSKNLASSVRLELPKSNMIVGFLSDPNKLATLGFTISGAIVSLIGTILLFITSKSKGIKRKTKLISISILVIMIIIGIMLTMAPFIAGSALTGGVGIQAA